MLVWTSGGAEELQLQMLLLSHWKTGKGLHQMRTCPHVLLEMVGFKLLVLRLEKVTLLYQDMSIF